MAGVVGQCLDLRGERGARRRDRRAARVPVRVARVPGPQDPRFAHRLARRVAPVRRRDRVPLSVRGVRVRGARGAAAVRSRAGAVALAGGWGDSAGACLLDVRVLLPVHPCRARQARRLDARGGGGARRRALGNAAPRDAAAAAPRARGAALLVFMTALGSFSAPYVFGGGFRVMTTQIVATKLNGELPLAMVETVALALVAILGFALLRRTEGDDILTALGKGSAPRRRAIRRAGVRTFATTAGWVLAVVLLLPHLTLVLVSLVPYGSWTTETLPPVLSLVNYRRLFSEAERLRPLVNSVWMAVTSTFAAVVLALVAGALVGRRRPWQFRGPIEALLALPWALPGTVFALALLTTFSKHDPLTLRWVLVGTTVLLPLGYLVRNLPVTGRAVLAGYRQLDPALDEAAASLGAGGWATFRRVTLPLLKPALAAGGSLALVAALGDFVTSIVLYTPDNRPIAIEIMSSLRVSELGVAAGFGVILMVLSAAVLGVGARR